MAKDLGLVQVVIAADEVKIPTPSGTTEMNLYILTDSYSAPTTWTLKGKDSGGTSRAITAL